MTRSDLSFRSFLDNWTRKDSCIVLLLVYALSLTFVQESIVPVGKESIVTRFISVERTKSPTHAPDRTPTPSTKTVTKAATEPLSIRCENKNNTAMKIVKYHLQSVAFDFAVYDTQTTKDHVARTISQSGAWEPAYVLAIVEHLKKLKNPVFIDVGANMGSILFAVAGFGFRSYGVEGFEGNQMLLKETWCRLPPKLQSNVKVFAVGVGRTPKTCLVTTPSVNYGDGIFMCPPHVMNVQDLFAQIRHWVDIERLDSLFRFLLHEKPAPEIVMKIDIEGMEQEALQSLTELLPLVKVVTAEYNKILYERRGAKDQWFHDYAKQHSFTLSNFGADLQSYWMIKN